MMARTFINTVAVTAALVAMPGMANNQTFDLDSLVQIDSGDQYGFGNIYQLSNGGVTMTMSAWSDDGPPNDSGVRAAKMVDYTDNPAHWGITNRDECSTGCYPGSPAHGADNGGDYDFFLLEFTEPVNFTGVWADWYSSDSDISVAAFDSNPVTVAGSGVSIPDLLTDAGAVFTKGYSNIAGSSYTAIDTGDTYENYWMISAYSTLVMDMGYNSDWDDSLKFSGWKTRTQMGLPPNTSVPLPGSLALMLAGVLVLGARSQVSSGDARKSGDQPAERSPAS